MKKVILLFTVIFTINSLSAQQSVLQRFITGTGGTLNDTLDNGTVVTLDLSTDDVEQENDEVDSYFDDDLDCGWEGDPADQNLLHMGLRFVDLWIPQGAQIDSAFIVFHAHEGKSAQDVAEIDIYGEATDDAVTFDQANFNSTMLVTDRPQTSAMVDWDVAEEWIIWQPYKTADVGGIVQEIVNRPGWQSGNAMAFLMLATNQGPSTVENAREFTSFENIADPDDVDPQGNPGDGTNWPSRRPYLMVYVDGALSVQEQQIDPVELFPNPVTQGELQLRLNSEAAADIEFIGLNGQKVAEFHSAEGDKVYLDLNDLERGIYLIKVTQNGDSFAEKVMVK